MACSRALLRVRQRKLCISNDAITRHSREKITALGTTEIIRKSGDGERDRLLMTKEKSFELDK